MVVAFRMDEKEEMKPLRKNGHMKFSVSGLRGCTKRKGFHELSRVRVHFFAIKP